MTPVEIGETLVAWLDFLILVIIIIITFFIAGILWPRSPFQMYPASGLNMPGKEGFRRADWNDGMMKPRQW